MSVTYRHFRIPYRSGDFPPKGVGWRENHEPGTGVPAPAEEARRIAGPPRVRVTSAGQRLPAVAGHVLYAPRQYSSGSRSYASPPWTSAMSSQWSPASTVCTVRHSA